MEEEPLVARLGQIARQAKLTAWAAAVEDLEIGRCWAHEGERWFHAASTFKVAILLGLLKAVAEGSTALEDHLQVRNRFRSLVEGAPPFRVDGDRDGDQVVHRHIGQSMPLRQLATRMITRSSNLATNLLLDFLGLEKVRAVLAEAGLTGLEVRRGVEDLAAYEAGINNEATALGLVRLFRVFEEPGFLPEPLRAEGMGILFAQEFRAMLPAKLPKGVRVANKTGEISTHSHDAGLVFNGSGRPYAVAILTESSPKEDRTKAVAEMSRALFDFVRGHAGAS